MANNTIFDKYKAYAQQHSGSQSPGTTQKPTVIPSAAKPTTASTGTIAYDKYKAFAQQSSLAPKPLAVTPAIAPKAPATATVAKTPSKIPMAVSATPKKPSSIYDKFSAFAQTAKATASKTAETAKTANPGGKTADGNDDSDDDDSEEYNRVTRIFERYKEYKEKKNNPTPETPTSDANEKPWWVKGVEFASTMSAKGSAATEKAGRSYADYVDHSKENANPRMYSAMYSNFAKRFVDLAEEAAASGKESISDAYNTVAYVFGAKGALLNAQANQNDAEDYFGEEAWSIISEGGLDAIAAERAKIPAEIEAIEKEMDATIKARDAALASASNTDSMSDYMDYNETLADLEERRDALIAKDKALAEAATKYTDLQNYQKEFGYVVENDDFADKSEYKERPHTEPKKEYIPNEYGGYSISYSSDGYENDDDFLYELVNGNQTAWEICLTNGTPLDELFGVSKKYITQMTPSEVALFNYLFDVEGPKKARAYLAYKKDNLEGRLMDSRLSEVADWSKDKPFWASVATVLASPLKMISHTGQLIDYAFNREVNPNAFYNYFSRAISTARGSVAEDKSGIGKFAYQTGMSMLDSTLAKIFGQVGSLVVLGGSASADAVLEAKLRGASDDAAFWYGQVMGGIEVITEKIGVDAWFEAIGSAKKMGKAAGEHALLRIVGVAAKQAGAEGTEELLADLMAAPVEFVDFIISGDKSEWGIAYQKYKDKGLSDNDAFVSVLWDKMKEAGLDTLGGAISGGTSVTLAQSVAYGAGAMSRRSRKKITASNRADILMDGMTDGGEGQERYNLIAEAAGVTAEDSNETVRTKLTKYFMKNDGKSLELLVTEASAQQVQDDNQGSLVRGTDNGYYQTVFDAVQEDGAARRYSDTILHMVEDSAVTDADVKLLNLTTDTQSNEGIVALRAVFGQDVTIEKTNTVDEARGNLLQIIDDYNSGKRTRSVATESAVATAPSETQSAVAPPANTDTAQTVSQAQLGYEAATDAATPQEVTPAAATTAAPVQTAPVQEVTPATAAPMQASPIPAASTQTAEGQAAPNAEAVELSPRKQAFINGMQGGMDYAKFRTAYLSKYKNASTAEIVSAFYQYNQSNAAGKTQTAGVKASTSDVQTERPRSTIKSAAAARASENDAVHRNGGLVQDEVSDTVAKRYRQTADDLGKLFRVAIRFDTEQNNPLLAGKNGYYDAANNEIVLNIEMRKGGNINEAAYALTMGHEVTHLMHDVIGEEAFSRLVDYATKFLGDDALQSKLNSGRSKAAAEEDLVCDFVGAVIGSSSLLDKLCTDIRSGAVERETATGLAGAIRRAVARITGKATVSQSTQAMRNRIMSMYGANIQQAEAAVREIQKALAQASKQQGKSNGLRFSEKDTAGKLNIDNAENTVYPTSRNGGVENDSNRMAERLADEVPGRQDYGGRYAEAGRIGRENQSLPRRTVSKSLSNSLKQSGVEATELYNYSADSAAYSIALDNARKADKDFGWCVTLQSADELKGKKLFMDASGTIGYVITDTGDIEGVFKNKQENKTPHALYGVMPQAIADGGVKLDCYGIGLVRQYEKFGFTPVARVEFNEEYANEGWDESKGKPYIYFMVHNGDSAEMVAANIAKYEHMKLSDLENLPTYGKEGYDDAAAYRDSLLEQRDIRFSDKDTAPDATRATSDTAQQSAEKKPARIWTKAEVDAAKQAAEQKYGTIEQGEKPARQYTIPRKMNDDTKVRRTVRTAAEAGITTDAMLEKIDEALVKNAFNYQPKHNQETMDKAHEWVDTFRDANEAYDNWSKEIARGSMSADNVARGWLLYNNFVTASEVAQSEYEHNDLLKKAVDIIQSIGRMSTIAGQTVQANRMLKKMSPEMQHYALENAVRKLQADINERFTDGKVELKIDDALLSRWLQALRNGDTTLATDYEELIMQNIAKQVPKTWQSRIDAWRYLSMLGNPKTLIRNAIGNAVFTPTKALRDEVGAFIELLTLREKNKKKNQRTKYFGLLRATARGRALLEYASEDVLRQDVQRRMDRVKYDDGNPADRLHALISEEGRKFNAPVLKQWQQFTSFLMEDMPLMGDTFYKSVHYKQSFAGAAMARGYTVEDIRSGKVTEQQLDDLRNYAAVQALKATFNDANAVSGFMARLHVKGDGKFAKAVNIGIEGVVPFKRTPANVLVRGFEYSPLGLVKALTADIYAVKKGTITTSEYIERLANGLTGVGIWGLGFLASSLGIIKVKLDDDDDKLKGKQNYSLELGGKSVSLDWVAPISIPFFMGAEMKAIIDNAADEETSAKFLDVLFTSATDAVSPMLEMSMLSGVKDLLDTFSYAYGTDGADVGQIIMALFVQPAFSYLGQFVPTLLGQLANATEPYRTQTYVNGEDGAFTRAVKQNIAKITEKIPFVDRWQTDYVDAWGRKDKNTIWERIGYFINPAYVNTITVTDADEEIARLREETDEDLTPTNRKKFITVAEYDENGNKIEGSEKKIHLTAEQYTKYQTEYGRQYSAMLTAMLATSYYKNLPDADKVSAVKDIESLADAYGRIAAGVGYEVDPGSQNDKLLELVQDAKIPVADAFMAKLLRSEIYGTDGIASDEKASRFVTFVEEQGWTAKQRAAVYKYSFSKSAPQIGDYAPTMQDVDDYRNIQSQYAEEMLHKVLNSREYKAADAAMQTLMVKEAMDVVDFKAKRDWAKARGLSTDDYDPATATNKIDTLMKAGISFYDAVEAHAKFKEFDGADDNKTINEMGFKRWVENHAGWSDAQKTAVEEAYKVTRTMPVDTDTYDKYRGLGFDPDDAYELAEAMLGKSNDAEKFRAAISVSGMSDADKWTALRGVKSGDSNESARAKMTAIEAAGVSPEVYVSYVEAKKTVGDANGTWNQAELGAWLDSQVRAFKISIEQAAVIWRNTNSSWSASYVYGQYS